MFTHSEFSEKRMVDTGCEKVSLEHGSLMKALVSNACAPKWPTQRPFTPFSDAIQGKSTVIIAIKNEVVKGI